MNRAESPRRLSSADRRAQILEAAAQLFVHKGFEAVSMGDIAHTLGTSRPTIYSYFTSTDALLDTLLGERLGTLLGRLDPLLPVLRRTLPEQEPTRALKEIFDVLLSERETLTLLHCGSGPEAHRRRHAFLNALGARLQLDPGLRHGPLLLIITTLLESLAFRVVAGEEVETERLSADLARFIRGGVWAVIGQGENPETCANATREEEVAGN